MVVAHYGVFMGKIIELTRRNVQLAMFDTGELAVPIEPSTNPLIP